MNLPILSDIDPETWDTWDLGATGIGFEPKHVLVEFLRGFELRRFRVDPHGMVVDFKNANAHGRSPTGLNGLIMSAAYRTVQESPCPSGLGQAGHNPPYADSLSILGLPKSPPQ